ncbi:Chloroperoxidase [Microdochium trichocladiopsis]|uniref:Chloroperoxidase n=1 Tax=Microdochium trichocladiopsis TaxID=1682393 RepID=A0A9P9BMW3_9PEZI|nr:Chloroperoxidase [Microdochium trichocladiopsis]KAH7026683.1 Chloroperoxidase [Microdochium trichocladiopsis]
MCPLQRPPGEGDLRGPCPGLNILANYGYINRNGYDTTVNIILASNKVFGMGIDLATAIAGYCAVVAGDILTLGLGLTGDNGILGSLLGDGLLGKPKGLDWSHYRFESDVSPTRNDVWYDNDPASIHIERFTSLYNRGLTKPGKGGIDLTVLTPHRQEWTRHSIANNPYYWNGPFTGLAVVTATHIFTYRFHANYTTGSLDGYLDGEALKLWEGVSGEPGNFKFTYGSERIPPNWYRRPAGFDYGLKEFSVDALWTLEQVPDLAAFGGNTGKVNSFVDVNVTDVTGGVLTATSLLEGNNMLCFAFATLHEFIPDLTRGLVKNTLQAVNQITDALAPVFAALDCPQLSKLDASYYDQFPSRRSAI